MYEFLQGLKSLTNCLGRPPSPNISTSTSPLLPHPSFQPSNDGDDGNNDNEDLSHHRPMAGACRVQKRHQPGLDITEATSFGEYSTSTLSPLSTTQFLERGDGPEHPLRFSMPILLRPLHGHNFRPTNAILDLRAKLSVMPRKFSRPYGPLPLPNGCPRWIDSARGKIKISSFCTVVIFQQELGSVKLNVAVASDLASPLGSISLGYRALEKLGLQGQDPEGMRFQVPFSGPPLKLLTECEEPRPKNFSVETSIGLLASETPDDEVVGKTALEASPIRQSPSATSPPPSPAIGDSLFDSGSNISSDTEVSHDIEHLSAGQEAVKRLALRGFSRVVRCALDSEE